MYTTVLRLAWLVPSLWCYFVAPSEGVYGGDGPLSAIQFAFSVSLLGYEQAVAPCSYFHASTAWWTKATVQAWTKPMPASLVLFLVNNLKAALSPTGNYTKSKCHHHLLNLPSTWLVYDLKPAGIQTIQPAPSVRFSQSTWTENSGKHKEPLNVVPKTGATAGHQKWGTAVW